MKSFEVGLEMGKELLKAQVLQYPESKIFMEIT